MKITLKIVAVYCGSARLGVYLLYVWSVNWPNFHQNIFEMIILEPEPIHGETLAYSSRSENMSSVSSQNLASVSYWKVIWRKIAPSVVNPHRFSCFSAVVCTLDRPILKLNSLPQFPHPLFYLSSNRWNAKLSCVSSSILLNVCGISLRLLVFAEFIRIRVALTYCFEQGIGCPPCVLPLPVLI